MQASWLRRPVVGFMSTPDQSIRWNQVPTPVELMGWLTPAILLLVGCAWDSYPNHVKKWISNSHQHLIQFQHLDAKQETGIKTEL